MALAAQLSKQGRQNTGNTKSAKKAVKRDQEGLLLAWEKHLRCRLSTALDGAGSGASSDAAGEGEHQPPGKHQPPSPESADDGPLGALPASAAC